MLVLNFKKKTDNDAWVFKCDASRWYLCLRSERGRSGGCRLVQELRVHLVVMSAQVLSEQVTQDLACLITNTPPPPRVHTRLLFQHSTPSLRVQSLSLSQHDLSSASFCSSPPPPPPLFIFLFIFLRSCQSLWVLFFHDYFRRSFSSLFLMLLLSLSFYPCSVLSFFLYFSTFVSCHKPSFKFELF